LSNLRTLQAELGFTFLGTLGTYTQYISIYTQYTQEQASKNQNQPVVLVEAMTCLLLGFAVCASSHKQILVNATKVLGCERLNLVTTSC
jgi:hypothetical protein